MNYSQQKQKFQKNWTQNLKKFGQESWTENPDFLYLVEIPIPPDLEKILKEDQRKLGQLAPETIPVDTFHITIALPGRLGTHFQKNDVPFMKKKLLEIISEYEAFSLKIGDINCFPTVVFREVYDETGVLYKMHEEICQAIPFSQNPEYQFENFMPHLSLLYGGNGMKNFLEPPDFERGREVLDLWVEKIQFGSAQNDKEKYERNIFAEYNLPN